MVVAVDRLKPTSPEIIANIAQEANQTFVTLDEYRALAEAVEVLSPSTQGYDRGEKFRKYRSIPSLSEYLLVSQSEAYIEHYSKSDSKPEKGDIWQLQISNQLDQKITLPSLNIEIPLSEIYCRINLSTRF